MTETAPPPDRSRRTRARLAARTLRTDRWWVGPLLTALGLAAFVGYATVRVFQQDHYWVPEYHYLTPFYSPCLSASCAPGSAVFGTLPWVFPWFLPYALVSLPFLLLFRFTCYYYRKAYYRAFWQSPPACAVREPHAGYTGESRLPLLGQNLHRYFFYVAVLISLVNTYDAAAALAHGVGLGGLILLANVVLLWCYTLSCHSCRHVIGGRLRSFRKHPLRYRLWTWVSALNSRHMLFAWITLGTLVLTDMYVLLVSSGTIADPRILH
ncbi:hypothetical protein [Marinitenerispora sediminis]|uniref:Succinate dehydrogenase n=1 Tax=Marinitenerispora sediminis TaxID=1931232 RepID=A0A368T8J8_9ACTN|nr:hypothetical protein [Marinitenerispora sediminis]RCV53592.1 hypothetical protein DEF28_10205 [Marinitenerispora sediminis]RCV55953.1 hypothetical protein DEF23_13495 [Marinitenerispora sediminis]RCV60679.1 hypothetical protein DEF24_06460 [Marinitenerispora sediminis]